MPGPSFLGAGPLQIDSATASYFLNGNVGIGTASPFTKLANSPTNYLVNGIGVGTNSLLWRSNEPGYTASFVQDSAGGALNQAGVSINIAEIANNVAPDKNAALAVLSGNIMRLMVAANGNVGIGTTIPGAKLDVSGDVAILNFGAGAAYRARRVDGAIKPLLFVQNDADLADATRLRSAGSGVAIQSDAGANLMVIRDGGSVGVGSQTPSGLQVNMAVDEAARGVDNVRLGVFAGTPRIVFEDTPATQWEIDNFNGTLRIFQPGVVRLAVASDGNVGIGTSGPAAKLDVAGGAVRVGGQEVINASGRCCTRRRGLGTVRGCPDPVGVGAGLAPPSPPAGDKPPRYMLPITGRDAGSPSPPGRGLGEGRLRRRHPFREP